MKVAYLHILPVEYYPPATNTLNLLGQSCEVRCYSTSNAKGLPAFVNESVRMRRTRVSRSPVGLIRLAYVLWWHLSTALSLWRFRPDAVIYVEPHSALGAYLYFKYLGGRAKLLVHHHEYYAPQDYDRPGQRMPRLGHRLETQFLFKRADWISQTNHDRLRMIREEVPEVDESVWQVFPNYPPADWYRRDRDSGSGDRADAEPLRVVYVGSASFRDTYIRELVQWAGMHPEEVRLHVCGFNVDEDVWQWIAQQSYSNVTTDHRGYRYAELPEILAQQDVGVVLYKGNTTNFVYNAPNKLFEYLTCGLDVWYPREMLGIANQKGLDEMPIRELDFTQLQQWTPEQLRPNSTTRTTRFTAERASQPMFDRLGIPTELEGYPAPATANSAL